MWIVFGAALLGVSYSILLAAVFSRSENMTNDQIRATTQNASGYVLVVVPSLVSMVRMTHCSLIKHVLFRLNSVRMVEKEHEAPSGEI